jgi:hypothetical protein
MTDQTDIAQLKLEGRCVECRERLPKHDTECSQHPRRFVLKAIDGLKQYLIKKTKEEQ